MGEAVQLGKTFSSNYAGDGPEEDEITGKCLRCLKAVRIGCRACEECYEKGFAYIQDACAVCHMRTEIGCRRRYTESGAKEANEFLNSSEGTAIYEALCQYRDLHK